MNLGTCASFICAILTVTVFESVRASKKIRNLAFKLLGAAPGSAITTARVVDSYGPRAILRGDVRRRAASLTLPLVEAIMTAIQIRLDSLRSYEIHCFQFDGHCYCNRRWLLPHKVNRVETK